MTAEIDLASEFVCLSFIVWGARAAQWNKAAAALALVPHASHELPSGRTKHFPESSRRDDL